MSTGCAIKRMLAALVPHSLGAVIPDYLPRLEFADPGPVLDVVVDSILAGTKTTTSERCRRG